jgi:1,4-dihydroxy-2-naphthoate octaprenyltransferase
VALSESWWLLIVGGAAILAAWFYTGGRRPYGYRALGELSVFVFFGLVAVLGTMYVQAGRVTWAALVAAVGMGMLICAMLVVNNLRDAPKDGAVGKRTLAVVVGDQRTRVMYVVLMTVPFVLTLALVAVAPTALLALLALPVAVLPARKVAQGAAGPALIGCLRDTGRAQLAYGLLLGLGLALS